MKKALIISIFLFAAIGCQKKEEPGAQYQFPSGQPQITQEVNLLKEAVNKDPNNTDAWIKLGNIMMDNNRNNEAIDAYQKALAIDSGNVDIRVDMATCYRKAGSSDIAAKEYKKAIKINPDHLNAHRNLAIVLAYDLKDKKQAMHEFETTLKLAPNAPEAEQIKKEIIRLR
jgi:Tfp pilus assembly protein PilF